MPTLDTQCDDRPALDPDDRSGGTLLYYYDVLACYAVEPIPINEEPDNRRRCRRRDQKMS
jgi:hypothetical protein